MKSFSQYRSLSEAKMCEACKCEPCECELDEGLEEDTESDPVTKAVLNFYKPVVNDIHKEKLPDYADQSQELLHQTNDPKVRRKLIDIFKKGKENPYIQGGIVTTVGALLAGGVLTTAQRMGLSPAQTNLALQAILNTVIPTVVSRINGKSWKDTIKYTLASASIGTAIAGAGLIEEVELEEAEQIDELSQDTLKNYVKKVANDAMKHPADPTKRPAEKRSNTVAGFSKALNRLPPEKFFNKEETEDLEELNKDTLTSYQDKADMDITRKHRVLGPQIKAGDAKAANKTADTIQKRMTGIDRAVTRLNKEETEMDLMSKYVAAISKDVSYTNLDEKTLTPAELKKREEVAKAMERENPGMDKSKKMAIATATAKKLTEVSKELAAKAYNKMADSDDDSKNRTGLAGDQSDRLKSKMKKKWGEKDTDAAIQKDSKKVAEEVEDLDEASDELSSRMTSTQNKTAAGKERERLRNQQYVKTMMKLTKAKGGLTGPKNKLPEEAKSHTVPKTAKEKDLAALAEPKDKITHADVMVGRGVKKEDTHYCAKHVFSERFGEGMVVEGQHAEPNEQGLIEWYDVDFGGTVRRVMTEKVKVMHAEYHMNHKKKMKEEDEVEDEDDKEEMKEMSSKEKMKRGLYNKEEVELDEVVDSQTHADAFKSETDTMRPGTKKYVGRKGGMEVHAKKDDQGNVKFYHKDGIRGRLKSVKEEVELDKQHVQKLSMEEVVAEAMISYSDFQSKIDAHRKAGNQIKDDKYDKKKASYTVVDQEGTAKKITHTDAGVSQQHLGSMKRDDSDDKSAETKPKETRGRGRPAGSKSGARRHN